MSLPDGFSSMETIIERMKRKYEDYEDDYDSYHLHFARMRKDDQNPNSSFVSGNSFTDEFTLQHPYIRSKASTFSSTQAAAVQSYPNRIQFFVRMNSDGKTLVFNGRPYDTVEVIHEKIQSVTGIPMIEQRLVYCGRLLQRERTLAECMIKNDSALHLVGQIQSENQPKAWQVIDDMISATYKLRKGDLGVSVDSVRLKMVEFLRMIGKKEDEDHLCVQLNIFQSLCAPSALVMLYKSRHTGNKECAEESIQLFINHSKTISKPKHSQFAPVMLDFCKVLGRAVRPEDPLSNLCRSSLGSMVKDLKIGNYSNNNTVFITVEDVFSFVTELASNISDALNSDMKCITYTSPKPNVIRDFGVFLRPLRAAIKDHPEFDDFIQMPICFNLSFYNDEIKLLYMIFYELFESIKMYLDQMEVKLEEYPKGVFGWGYFLVIFRELRKISKLFQGMEETFWENMKHYKVSLRYLIVKYAKRGENYKWICGRKDVLNSESRRHLVNTLFPEVKDKYPELHEMLIDRSELLAQSFEYIARVNPEKLRRGLFMMFKDEEATGVGVLREWFFLVCRELFNPRNSLFVACPEDLRRFFPNFASKVNPTHLEHFQFAGRIIALALMHKVQVGIVFDRVFFLQLAGFDISLDDIKEADPCFYKSCKQILEMDRVTVDQDALGLTFVHEFEELGSMKVVELFTNGKNIIVNSRNREEYVDLLVKHRFLTLVKDQLTHFAKGFEDIIGDENIRKLFFESLELVDLDAMLCGSESIISVEDWKNHTEYHGYKETDPQIQWFWEIVEEMTGQQRKVLLSFWTSLKHVPIEGFGGLTSKLHIYKSNETFDFLPSSRTCFYRLSFPAYPSMDVMQKCLNIITQEHVGSSFGTR